MNRTQPVAARLTRNGRASRRGVRIAIISLALALAACEDAPPDDDALRQMVDSMMPALERLSGLERLSPVQLERRTIDEVRAFVEQQVQEELPPDVLEGVRTVYTMLGLLPDTLRLRELLLDLYTEQIAGYYDPATEVLYVTEGVPVEALRTVVAHELVHALQDQHTDLDSLINRRRGNDRQAAAQAAIEGHATLAMFALLAEQASGRNVDPAMLPDPGAELRGAVDGGSAQFPVFASAPAILRETLTFPYSAGASFVREVWRNDSPGASHAAPLGEHLPQSTEQVILPLERYLTRRDVPTELRFDEDSTWVVAYENSLGAFELQVLLDEHLGRGVASATGWDGDRYRLVETPAGGRALVWVIVWDDEAAADRVNAAIQRIVESGGFGSRAAVERMDVEGRSALRLVITRDVDVADVPRTAVHCTDEFDNRIACATTAPPS